MRAGWRRHLPYLSLLVTGTGLLIVLSLLQHRALGTGYDSMAAWFRWTSASLRPRLHQPSRPPHEPSLPTL